MSYLILAADYLDYSLKGVGSPDDPFDRNRLPADVLHDLEEWNSAYQRIIVMNMDERATEDVVNEIARLDEMGLALTRRITSAMPGVKEVRYYSEGTLGYKP